MVDLILFSFIKALGLSPYTKKKKHQHIMSNFKEVSEISSRIYEIYYLRLCIINWWNYSLEFIWLFMAIDCNIQDSQVLLEKLVLKDFKINICNNINSWKFEWKSKIIKVFSFNFIKKLSFIICVFEVQTAFQFCLNDNNNKLLWNNKNNSFNNLSNILKQLCKKYWDFFNTYNTN